MTPINLCAFRIALPGACDTRFTLTASRWSSRFFILTVIVMLTACDQPGAGKLEGKSAQSAAAKGATEHQDKAEKKEEHSSEGKVKLSTEEMATSGVKVEELKRQSFVDQVVLTATIRAN